MDFGAELMAGLQTWCAEKHRCLPRLSGPHWSQTILQFAAAASLTTASVARLARLRAMMRTLRIFNFPNSIHSFCFALPGSRHQFTSVVAALEHRLTRNLNARA